MQQCKNGNDPIKTHQRGMAFAVSSSSCSSGSVNLGGEVFGQHRTLITQVGFSTLSIHVEQEHTVGQICRERQIAQRVPPATH